MRGVRSSAHGVGRDMLLACAYLYRRAAIYTANEYISVCAAYHAHQLFMAFGARNGIDLF